jgi:hypothetical protein
MTACSVEDEGGGGKTNQERADEFAADHSAILGKTTVTTGDETTVDAALAAYDALAQGVKDLLTTQKTLLDRLKGRIELLKAAQLPDLVIGEGASVADVRTMFDISIAVNDTVTITGTVNISGGTVESTSSGNNYAISIQNGVSSGTLTIKNSAAANIKSNSGSRTGEDAIYHLSGFTVTWVD